MKITPPGFSDVEYWKVHNVEVIDVGEFRIFGVREISDMSRLHHGSDGESGYRDGDRAIECVGGMVGYICTGDGAWLRHGDAAAYIPLMRSRFDFQVLRDAA